MKIAKSGRSQTVLREATPSEAASIEQLPPEVSGALERANDSSRRERLTEIRARIKAGTETAADRSRAIKILIGLALAEKAEAGE